MIPRQTAIEEGMRDFVKEVHIIYIYLNASPCCIFFTNPANHFAAAMADSSRKLYVHKVVRGPVSGRLKESLSAITVTLPSENFFAHSKMGGMK